MIAADNNICSDSNDKASMVTESTLISPNYPHTYPNRLDCRFTITTGSSYLCVKVVFATFDLEESRNCQYDSLSFYNGSVVDENKLVKRICGNAPEQQPIKLHSQVMIHLKTDTSVVGKGFKLKYQAVYCKDLPPCGRTLTGVQGLVTSPGFPSSYPDRENCYIHIRVPYVCRARVEFMAFDLEYQVTCNYDSLEVFDGYTTDYAKSIGKYCGNSIPTNLTSSTNELLLHFVSDSSVAQSGFKGRYTAVCPNACDSSPCRNGGLCEPVNYFYRCRCPIGYTGQNCESVQCSLDLVSGSGYITSPDYPRYYPSGLLCDFMICAREGDAVAVQFLDFRVEDSTSCTNDQLEVYDGHSPMHPLIGVYCGQLSQMRLNSTNECMLLRFASNGQLGATGFRIEYYSVKQGDPAHPCANRNGGCEQLCVPEQFNSYTCSCRTGYLLNSDDHTCEDIDECIPSQRMSNCQYPSTCVNTLGSYYCRCDQAGYRMGNDTMTCVDVDECLRPEVHACSQQCHNTLGSYYCGCNEGYTLSANAKQCIDIDECLSNRGGCSQSCQNTPGSFECYCNRGFKMNPNDNTTCLDEDECALLTEETCPRCRPTKDNWYRCVCPDGFRQAENPVTEGLGCIDIDECRKTPDICGNNANCLNTAGDYGCSCKAGFVNTTGSCIDVNECETDKGGCSDVCINTPGSHFCACQTGFLLSINGQNCTDIDECSDKSSQCTQLCANTKGSFVCHCETGYTLDIDGKTCLDVDECELGLANCSQLCNNTIGNYKCSCQDGYRLQSDMHQCQDINECALGNGGCQHTCNNFPGGHFCSCHDGYLSDNLGITCDDIDECLSTPCNMTCQNTNGSFFCGCPGPQFELHENGRDCLDVDECRIRNGGCDHSCLNTYGGYECKCFKGYEQFGRNGRQCRDIDECSATAEQLQDDCDQICNNIVGSYNCSCRAGFMLLHDNKTCIDIDECALNVTDCSQVCENVRGSYRCSCFPGFEVNSDDFHVCDDVNECLNNNGNCSGGCVNLLGSYECTCEVTEKLGSDQHFCSACPTCNEFVSLREEVSEMKALLLEMQTKIHDLEVTMVQNNVPSDESNSVAAVGKSGRRGA